MESKSAEPLLSQSEPLVLAFMSLVSTRLDFSCLRGTWNFHHDSGTLLFIMTLRSLESIRRGEITSFVDPDDNSRECLREFYKRVLILKVVWLICLKFTSKVFSPLLDPVNVLLEEISNVRPVLNSSQITPCFQNKDNVDEFNPYFLSLYRLVLYI